MGKILQFNIFLINNEVLRLNQRIALIQKKNIRTIKIIICLLILLLIIVGVSRVPLPFVTRYQSKIAQEITTTLECPAEIEKMKAFWSGIHPWIELENIIVFDPPHSQPILKVKTIKLSINIFSSLWHRKIIPDDIVINGTEIIIKKLPNNKFVVNDIPVMKTSGNQHPFDWSFYTKIRYYLTDVNVILQGEKQTVNFHNLTFKHISNSTKIESQNLTVNFLDYLAKPLVFNRVGSEIDISADKSGWLLLFKNIQLESPVINLKGQANLEFTSDDHSKQNTVDLQLDYSFEQIDLINEYILIKNLSPQIATWLNERFISGNRIYGKLTLKGPLNKLNDFKNPEIDLSTNVKFGNIQINLQSGKPLLQNLTGEIILHYPEFKKSTITALFLGQPLKIDVASKITNNTNILNILISGQLSFDESSKIEELNFLSKLAKGNSAFNAEFNILNTAGLSPYNFKFNSDLKGVEVLLPEPLKKSAEVANPILMNISSTGGHLLTNIEYKKKLNAILVFNQLLRKNWTISKGDILLGKGKASLSSENGVTIRGNIPNLELSEISQYFTSDISNSNTSNKILPLYIYLSFDNLSLGGMAFGNTRLSVMPQNNNLKVEIKSSDVSGNIFIPADFNTQIVRADFDKFSFSSKELKKIKVSSAIGNDIKPSQIPSLDITFKQFRVDKNNLGNIHIVTLKNKNNLVLQKFTIKSPNVNLMINGKWEGNGIQNSYVNGNIKANNFGDFLKDWNITKSLEGSEGLVNFKLNWNGPIYRINLAELNGNFYFSLQNGVILNVTESDMEIIGGILNILSIAMLETLFSEPFSLIAPKRKGFDFETEEAYFEIVKGNLFTEDFRLKGKLADVKAKGRIGLAKRDYNLCVYITPFLTAYLPTSLALAGGPMVFGIVWAADKIMGELFNSWFMQTYRVTGPWEKPVYTKIVDAKVKKFSKKAVCVRRTTC